MRLFFLQMIVLMSISGSTNCISTKSSNFHEDQSIAVTQTPSQKSIHDVWQPAIFKELRIGVSTRSDAIKALGKPDYSGLSDQNDLPVGNDPANAELLDTYKNIDFFEEITIISSRKDQKIIEVMATPSHLSLEKVVKLYGENYRLTRYDFLECPGDAGSSLIRESQDGTLEYIEYRSKGIAIKTTDSGQKVDHILFVSKPIGLISPNCPKTKSN